MASWAFMKNQAKEYIDHNDKEETIGLLSKVDLSSYNLKELGTPHLVEILKEKGKMFENKLKNSTDDPEIRAKSRFLFYSRCRECIDDSKEEILDYGLGYKNRKFVAFGNQEYSGTIIPSNLEEIDEKTKKLEIELESFASRTPVFSDPSGCLYDVNYIPIKLDKMVLENGRGKLASVVNEKVKDKSSLEYQAQFSHFPELYQNQPEPNNFTSYEHYERALLNWHQKVEHQLGYLQLPKIMGRKYYRPYVYSKEDLQNEEEFLSFF
jgi:hypothetical protein